MFRNLLVNSSIFAKILENAQYSAFRPSDALDLALPCVILAGEHGAALSSRTLDLAASKLLKNVADTLFWWPESFGLFRSLYDRENEAWKMAFAFIPLDFRDQFYYRLAEIREQPLSFTLGLFWEREQRVRLIMD